MNEYWMMGIGGILYLCGGIALLSIKYLTLMNQISLTKTDKIAIRTLFVLFWFPFCIAEIIVKIKNNFNRKNNDY